ncbi:hypothetical protein FA95DRAFT_584281 [Auriscalpium vulgare]|uniref:Uncharacterized protein n=1 Tax=Auriscalpium vulgare TaxID=40419 RepID=A0ACB8REE3_9AGAM|nr:hypothetical protein FA95DRAFT_584281 [Auriscalpium vulgare]
MDAFCVERAAGMGEERPQLYGVTDEIRRVVAAHIPISTPSTFRRVEVREVNVDRLALRDPPSRSLTLQCYCETRDDLLHGAVPATTPPLPVTQKAAESSPKFDVGTRNTIRRSLAPRHTPRVTLGMARGLEKSAKWIADHPWKAFGIGAGAIDDCTKLHLLRERRL